MGNNVSETGRYSSYTPTCSAFKRQRKKEASQIPATFPTGHRLCRRSHRLKWIKWLVIKSFLSSLSLKKLELALPIVELTHFGFEQTKLIQRDEVLLRFYQFISHRRCESIFLSSAGFAWQYNVVFPF